eukprot:3843894-Pleurochrysis_carterae.AAC.1
MARWMPTTMAADTNITFIASDRYGQPLPRAGLALVGTGDVARRRFSVKALCSVESAAHSSVRGAAGSLSGTQCGGVPGSSSLGVALSALSRF